jgi:hypothetical protein
LSEAFKFSVYARGGARLWIDGRQRIFTWNEGNARRETNPIELAAGERYTVQLDFFTSHPHPACSLNWESLSLDRERIPTRYLYPDTNAPVAREPDARPATHRIQARTFDEQSGDISAGDVGGAIRGLRQRGLGVSGAWLGYHRIDFGRGVGTLRVRAGGRPAGRGDYTVTLTFRLDAPDGPPVAKVQLAEDTATIEVPVEGLAGTHDLYVENTTARHWHFIRFYWFAFE